MRGQTELARIFGNAALGLLLVGASGACHAKNAEPTMVESFLDADPIAPEWNPEISPAEPMWNRRIDLGRVVVSVAARCCVGGRFTAKYSDEPETRIMFLPGDYVYPTELRVARGAHIVYGRASGYAGGTTVVTRIFAFDLERRLLIGSQSVDPRVLPPEVRPLGLRPTR
jgi:hypothetical protein